MPSTCCEAGDPATRAVPEVPERLAFFYGDGHPEALEALAGFDAVVLQPDRHARDVLEGLADRGVRTLAYLSVGEDPGPPAPWQRPEHNDVWGGAHVRLTHPAWADELVAGAWSAMRRGYDGLFLDTLDVAALYPEDRSATLELLRGLGRVVRRESERGDGEVGDAEGVGVERGGVEDGVDDGRDGARRARGLLLANRGFALLPELAGVVDALVFEAFSSTWTPAGGCAPVDAATLERNVELAQRARASGLPLFALDYADGPLLATFARRRAELHGLRWVHAADRDLAALPRSADRQT